LSKRAASSGLDVYLTNRSKLNFHFRLILLSALAGIFLVGCSHRVWNQPLNQGIQIESYDFQTRARSNSEDIFIVLAFSGGGTRAAALSYGVLEKLAHTLVMVDGHQRRLLDEVDVITSVSGGSYTAAYYGLFGDKIFTEFSHRFLYQDWQSELLGLLTNPFNLMSLASSTYNRSDLVADHLNKTLFESKTFTDMSRKNLPFIIINAADINNLTTFSFTQPQFDFLCSDLSTYQVANAVMASSSVPGVFAPIALKNYADCDARGKRWIVDSLANEKQFTRQYAVARALSRYSDPARMPILRLSDGAVTDNLGVRGSMMSPVTQRGNVKDMAGAFTPAQLKSVKRVLVLVVNAGVYQEYDWSISGKEPSLLEMISASSDAALGVLNTETLVTARNEFLMWSDYVNSSRGPGETPVSLSFSTITFDQIDNLEERRMFNNLPTTFHLNPAQVDELRSLAGQLLDKSPDFQRFIEGF
jgi:NTE family protein